MATVSSFTTERMLEIENSTVVDGEVDENGHLILIRRDEETIDAGDVRGPRGFAPSGSVTAFAGTIAPEGWVMCHGQALSRSVYSDLFAVIGTTYGVGDGVSTFNVPNIKGKVIVGLDSAQTEFDVLGASGGAKTHSLTIAQMPTHTHVQNSHNHTQNAHTHTQAAHNHTQNAHTHTQAAHNHSGSTGSAGSHEHDARMASSSNTGSYTTTQLAIGKETGTIYSNPNSINGAGAHTHSVSIANETATNNNTTATNNSETAINNNTTPTNNATTATNQNTGGGEAHNNLQPYIVLNFMIAI